MSAIQIPADLLPADGRFGSGPSKVRQEALNNLVSIAPNYLGTSHRKTTVKKVVERLRAGMRELYSLPDGWEVALGNGGTTVFWDGLCFGFIERKSQHLSFGEFSTKFAKAVERTPFLDAPEVIATDPGTAPVAVARDDVDVYALTHNETSTGVMNPVVRPDAAGLVAVDATSAAGGLRVDITQSDCYYFAPQKAFASEGGLWVALLSPAALERIDAIEATGRWIPESIRLSTAIACSRDNSTYNTPSLSTIYLVVDQLEWMLSNGGLDWAAKRSEASANVLYSWAAESSFATPFVTEAERRSTVVGTIDIDDSVSADEIGAVLRANGIVDTEGYRKLGRNQLRIALFPSIETSDVEALTKCIDYVVERLA